MAHHYHPIWQMAILVHLCIVGHSDQLQLKSNCICPGYTLTFAECTVVGRSGSTIWRGSAFDCSSNEIVLSHSRFDTAAGECNTGSIVGRGVRVDGSNYTSELTIAVSPDMIGKTIECVHEALDAITVVGSVTITKPGPIPPPNKFYISAADFASREYIFDWSPVAPDCPAIHYNILSSNCGICPTTTNHTTSTATCTDVPTNGSVCTFAIQTVVCGNITGNLSDPIVITSVDMVDNNLTRNLSNQANTTTTIEKDSNNCLSITLEQNATLNTQTTFDKSGITFIPLLVVATLFIIWVAVSTVVIIVLAKAKIKVKCELKEANQAVITSLKMIDTSENVAYGMYSRGRIYLS